VTWLLGRGIDGCRHIVPLNDLDGHLTRDEKCACRPELSEDGNIVHNAFDGREAYETGKRLPH
jgi:hypothetical protein